MCSSEPVYYMSESHEHSVDQNEAGVLYEKLKQSSMPADQVCQADTMIRIDDALQAKKESM